MSGAGILAHALQEPQRRLPRILHEGLPGFPGNRLVTGPWQFLILELPASSTLSSMNLLNLNSCYCQSETDLLGKLPARQRLHHSLIPTLVLIADLYHFISYWDHKSCILLISRTEKVFPSLLRNEGVCHIIFFQTPSSPFHITQYIMKPCLGRNSSQFESWCSDVTVIEKWDLVSPHTRSAVKHRHSFSGRENSTLWSPTAGSVFGQLPTLASDILLTLLNGIVAYHILISILRFSPVDIKVKNTGMFLYRHIPHSNS